MRAIDGAGVAASSARDRNIGLVFQHHALFRHLDVFERIAFALTTVVVTHDQDEAFVGDRVVVMNRGRIEQAGSPAEIFEKPANDFVMRFLGQVHVLETAAGRVYVRPHEIAIDRRAATGEALTLGDGDSVYLSLRRTRASCSWRT